VVGVPAVGTPSPEGIVSSVDLPDPEAPTRAISSPRSTTRSKLCRATVSTPFGLEDVDQPVTDDVAAAQPVGAGVRPDPVPRSCGRVGSLDRPLTALLWY
jgi:hypothetical protein